MPSGSQPFARYVNIHDQNTRKVPATQASRLA
jgi:hypothetical protein